MYKSCGVLNDIFTLEKITLDLETTNIQALYIKSSSSPEIVIKIVFTSAINFPKLLFDWGTKLGNFWVWRGDRLLKIIHRYW